MNIKIKKICFLAVFIIISVIVIVFCVEYFTKSPSKVFEGTLVEQGIMDWSYL